MGEERTFLVAMSGGVDSSVAAGLLVRQGHRVIGATLEFRACDDDTKVSWCCGAAAEAQARDVSAALGIPHYVIKCDLEFESAVLRPAWDEYARGRTPSPCIACNARLKFGLLLDLARKLGAEKVATGHYARLQPGANGDAPALLRAVDRHKDQSYFLFSLSSAQLARAVFPLGQLRKDQVRQLAREMGLSNADRPESQDACFSAPDGGFAEGLRRRFAAEPAPGEIVDSDGNVVGDHSGIHQFTVGQRRGLKVSLGRRAYVAAIDAARRRVVITTDEREMESRGLAASGTVWTGDRRPDLPLRCQAQIRYRHPAAGAIVASADGDRLEVSFEDPQRAVAPGQAVVFYDDELVLGGSWIDGIADGKTSAEVVR
jgi:tRNA-specific 2-thiouridylase